QDDEAFPFCQSGGETCFSVRQGGAIASLVEPGEVQRGTLLVRVIARQRGEYFEIWRRAFPFALVRRQHGGGARHGSVDSTRDVFEAISRIERRLLRRGRAAQAIANRLGD